MGKFNSYLKKMYMEAIRNNKYVRVVVDFKSGEYWGETSETGFSIYSGEKAEEAEKRRDKIVEDIEEKTDHFEGKGAAAEISNNFFQAMKMKEEDEDGEDFYNWENFVPPMKSVKELVKPSYTTIGKKKKINGSLDWKAFYSYHTPEVVKLENDEKAKAEIYIFPHGKIEPFYLSIGEKDGDTLFHIKSDFFLNTLIKRGEFGEEVMELKNAFEDKDEEGKS